MRTAPVNGTGGYQQYLYCDSSHPHQLTGIYPTGTTCSNPTGAVYSTSYDAWGNVTSRTYNGSTATLSYDQLNRMVEWQNSTASTQEWYLYDASGTRVLRRSTSNGTTTLTTYPFGSEEHTYSGTGTLQSSTYYYILGGRLIGELTGSPTPTQTNLFLTDALGSALATFSNTANTATLLGNQTYGSQQYQSGSMGTNKGFTGQYNDNVTGLDYYNAR
jgi:YD repeat-containing protein